MNKYSKQKEFEAAAPALKRVMIAQDALDSYQTGFYRPIRGTYIAAEWKSGLWRHNKDLGKNRGDLQSCRVCALGGLLVSVLIRYNEGIYYRSTFDSLRNYFNADQLGDIELFFERSIYTPDKAFELAMQNIIDNNGTFVENYG